MELKDEDVLCIIRTLEFDGLVESFTSEDGEVYRPAKHRIPKTSAFTSIPCGVCPVSLLTDCIESITMCVDGGLCFYSYSRHVSDVQVLQVINECSDDGVISPATCTYYQAWLDF